MPQGIVVFTNSINYLFNTRPVINNPLLAHTVAPFFINWGDYIIHTSLNRMPLFGLEPLDAFNKDAAAEDKIEIRQIKYLNNIVEQDHRFIKKQTRPILGFKNFYSARETISGIENIRMIQKGQIIGQVASQSAYSNFVVLMA